MANLNNINKKLEDYFDSIGITEERVIELIQLGLINKVGSLYNLETNNKNLIVDAINELLNNDNAFKSIEDQLTELETIINTIKQNLINKLINNGIKENLSIDDDWEKLISYIDWFNDYNYKDKNVYKFTVSPSNTIKLCNNLRGDTFNGIVYTDWGDGTVDTNLSHTYNSAGTYIVKSKYSLQGTDGSNYDATTLSCLTDVIDINKYITNAAYMFSKCNNLQIIDGSIWNTSNVTTMNSMFSECTNLVAIYMDKWVVNNVNDIRKMFDRCDKLYY